MCLSLQAYYTYDDKSCKFSCQAIEYWWWSTAAFTGLIKNRSDVKKEFKYYLPEDFTTKDPKMFALITVSNTLEGKFLLFRVELTRCSETRTVLK